MLSMIKGEIDKTKSKEKNNEYMQIVKKNSIIPSNSYFFKRVWVQITGDKEQPCPRQ